MRKILALLLIVVVGATLSCAGGRYGQQAKDHPGLHGQEEKKHPGSEPYSPSKIEWLVMLLNSHFRTEGMVPPVHAFFFDYDSHDPETVIICFSYLPCGKPSEGESNDRLFELLRQSMRDRVSMIAEHYGWDWVKIREEAVSETRKWNFRGSSN